MKRSAFLSRRPHKYGANRTWSEIHQRSFPSAGEATRADQLALLERAGVISDLVLQPQVYLSAAEVAYKPDFRYVEDGRTVYEESKGLETSDWLLKQKLWTVYGPGELRVTRMNGKSCKTLRVIHPRNKEAERAREKEECARELWRRRIGSVIDIANDLVKALPYDGETANHERDLAVILRTDLKGLLKSI